LILYSSGGLIIVVEDGEDVLDLVAELGDAVQRGRVFLLRAGEGIRLGGEGLDAAAQSVYPDGQGRDRGRSVAARRRVSHYCLQSQ
jgi:hypothetical protein